MMLIRRNMKDSSLDLVKISRELVNRFFECSESVKLECPDEYKAFETSPDIICEVFRHSLCMALNLQSVLSEPVFSEICEKFKESWSDIVSDYSRYSVIQRQSILQAAVHCIVYATKNSRVGVDINGSK